MIIVVSSSKGLSNSRFQRLCYQILSARQIYRTIHIVKKFESSVLSFNNLLELNVRGQCCCGLRIHMPYPGVKVKGHTVKVYPWHSKSILKSRNIPREVGNCSFERSIIHYIIRVNIKLFTFLTGFLHSVDLPVQKLDTYLPIRQMGLEFTTARWERESYSIEKHIGCTVSANKL